jgi:predicted Rossmann fold nucleotide-binding protein DprA/Smf involved in DNA uptake
MERFSNCLEYEKTCSLITLIGKTERKVSNSSLSIQRKRAEILRDWFVFFKGRVDSTYLKNTEDLLDEFAFIVIRVHDIFRDLYKVLDKQDQQTIQQMKKDEYGYPTFKKIYHETTNELEKLYQEASERLKEIKTRSFLALPEL